ncbi:MAG: hypothetical protein AAFP16_16015 [Pseudomonadota bacterium]
MAPRLIVHAGFHKTGTTSVQRALNAHHDVLADHLLVRIRADFIPLCEAARAWSISRDPVDLGLVQYEAALAVEGWTGDVPLLLSSEDLSGHMPGRHRLTGYDASPTLAKAMVEAWRAAHPDVDITLLYTTRAAAPWLASCYAQNLWSARMRLTRAEYVETYATSARLDDIAAGVADATGVTVHTLPLEDAQTRRLGPVDPVLDHCGVPDDLRARFRPLPRANTAASKAKQAAFLDLNRSELQGDAYQKARRTLRAQDF